MEDLLGIEVLLSKRDYDFQSFTKKIIDRFVEKLTRAAQVYLKTDRPIHWYSIDKLSKVPHYAVVVGNIEIRPGDVIKTADGEIVVDEATVRNYANTYRAYVPMKLLDEGTTTLLYKHLRDFSSISKMLSEEDLIKYLNAVGDINQAELINDPKHEKILDKMTKPLVVDGFDTETLSDDQILSINIFSNNTRGVH